MGLKLENSAGKIWLPSSKVLYRFLAWQGYKIDRKQKLRVKGTVINKTTA